MSNYINDQVKPGQSVEVMPPDGRFYTVVDEENRKTYYLFGAGSGITPLFSIIKTILEKEPQSTVFLFYGNRNEDCIIFKEQLEALQKRYADQFVMELILSQPKRTKGKGFSGIFSKGTISWPGKVGRLSKKVIDKFLEKHPARYANPEYFICGPGNMIDSVEAALFAKGIDKKHIHTERFSSVVPGEEGKVAGKEGAAVKVHLDGEVVTVTVPAKKTILDTLLETGYDPPYSCSAGACSTCMAKIIKGSVEMETCHALDDEEVANGYILTCQSHPTSDELELTYEV